MEHEETEDSPWRAAAGFLCILTLLIVGVNVASIVSGRADIACAILLGAASLAGFAAYQLANSIAEDQEAAERGP